MDVPVFVMAEGVLLPWLLRCSKRRKTTIFTKKLPDWFTLILLDSNIKPNKFKIALD